MAIFNLVALIICGIGLLINLGISHFAGIHSKIQEDLIFAGTVIVLDVLFRSRQSELEKRFIHPEAGGTLFFILPIWAVGLISFFISILKT